MTSYASWNEATGRFFLTPDHAGRRVVLTADPETLLDIARDAGLTSGAATSEQAVASLTTAVQQEVLANGWTLGQLEKDRYPHCLAMLAVFVLAAFRMETREEKTGNAYWYRLRELLDPTEEHRSRGALPLGLTEPRFEELWRGLREWANRIQQKTWGFVELPPDRPGPFRLVRIPKSQALLRIADLRGLPRFFQHAGLRPGAPPEELKRKVERSLRFFTSHARRVLEDEHRAPLALGQIAEALSAWDGNADDRPPPRRRERLQHWLRLHHELERIEGGRLEGEGRTVRVDLTEILEPRGVLLAVWDDFEELFREKHKARPGDRVLLLSPASEGVTVYETARLITESGHLQAWGEPGFPSLEGLPAGWIAMDGMLVTHPLDGDLGPWNALLHRQASVLRLEGGLRLSRNVRMAGAGPNLVLTDADRKEICIDGRPYPVVDGRITPADAEVLDEPGRHEVQVGDTVVEVRVDVPRLAAHEPNPAWTADPPGWPDGQRSTRRGGSGRPGVEGAWIEGAWEESTRGDMERRWLKTVLEIRGGCPRSSASHHPLIRQLRALSSSGRRTRPMKL